MEVNILEAKLNNIWELNFGIKLSQQLKLGKEEKIKKEREKKLDINVLRSVNFERKFII